VRTSTQDSNKPRRVFVALWPTPAVRERLSEVAADLVRVAPRARPVPPANIHQTLAFIGSLARDRVAELASRLERCEAPVFEWTLDYVGHFNDARVLWAGGPESTELSAQAARVRALLDSLGIEYDRKPFAPHVTLLRSVLRWRKPRWLIEPPIVWPCERPVLLRSQPTANGVTYVPETAC
jgi:2'-5' RNA ligase